MLRIVTSTPRISADCVDGTGVAQIVRELRRIDPDVVLINGEVIARKALTATWLSGHRAALVSHGTDPSADGSSPRATGAVTPVAAEGKAAEAVLPPPPQLMDDPDVGSAGVHEAARRLTGVIAALCGRPGAGIPLDETPQVSVVVPVWCEGDLVDDLVDSLVPQLLPGDELVLVDDGSPDDTGARVEQAARANPQVRAVVLQRNAGAGAARNAGITAASHDHLVFTDAGCHWGRGWLDAMRRPFAEAPAPGLVAGAYEVSKRGVLEAASALGCYPDVCEVRRAGPVSRAWGRVFGRRFDPTRPAGRAMATTRQAIEAAGGWPEDIRAHEDLDLAQAIAQRGVPCVLTTDAELKWDQAGIRGTWRMYVRYGRGDAEASDRQALMRNGVRVLAYFAGPVLLVRGGVVLRSAVLCGALAYFSVPMFKARGAERPLATSLLVPVPIVAKDLAKTWGALQVVSRGVLEHRSRRRRASGTNFGEAFGVPGACCP
ncbi:hypothetical protein NUM3379_07140 [Kineococcus sp. NUM-3379]